MGCGFTVLRGFILIFILSILVQDPCRADGWMVQERSSQILPQRRMNRGGKYMRFGRSPYNDQYNSEDVDLQQQQLLLQKLLQRHDHQLGSSGEIGRGVRGINESEDY